MKSLRAKLDALLRSQSAAAAKKLMSGAMADDELRQLEQVQKLLNFVPQENKATLFAAGAVAVTCLVGACVLWTIRLPTHVQMNVTSDSVTIKLANELSWSGNWDLSGGLLRLEDMSRIEIPPELANANLLSGRPWLEISNGDFGLKHLEVQSNAQVSVKRTEFHTLKISSWNAPLLGQLEVFGTPRMQAGLSPEQAEKLPETHFEIPGTITFYHDASQTPAILRIAPRGSIELTDLAVQELSFAREVTDSETSFRSGIVKGNLTILSTGENLPLDAGNRLRLEGVEGIISKPTVSGDGATLVFEGKVRSASTGPSGFERELQPSLLEYLYHQQRLGFFWAAVSFLWGVLWSARTLIFK